MHLIDPSLTFFSFFLLTQVGRSQNAAAKTFNLPSDFSHFRKSVSWARNPSFRIQTLSLMLEVVLLNRKSIMLVILALCACAARADQVTLKNGDRLTGTIEKSDDKQLIIKTEFAGEVTVQWSAIQDIKSDQPLHVGLKGGQTVVGPVSTADGKVEVSTKTNGSVEAPKENIVVMRSDTEQSAWEKRQHPGLLEGWNGGLNIGFGFTAGNSETKNLALAFSGIRTGLARQAYAVHRLCLCHQRDRDSQCDREQQ